LLADSSVTFSAVIGDAQYLAAPLTYEWLAQGVVSQAQVVPWQLKTQMPAAGHEIDVLLTVTDASGFKLFATVSQTVLSQQVIQWRTSFCELIHRIETTAIFNWPINPLGPPIQPGDGLLKHEQIAEAETLATELGQVLGNLKREDGGPVIRAAPARLFVHDPEAWTLAYPSGEDAKYLIPLRADNSR
jgi:hypothetical protein